MAYKRQDVHVKRKRKRLEDDDADTLNTSKRVELIPPEDGVAKVIYMTHWTPDSVGSSRHPAPIWENASDDVKNFVRKQARNVLDYLKDKANAS